jgi:UDPglucose--hexose-1-phosphate uridylyltransferase
MTRFYFDELTGTPTILAENRVKRPDQTGSISKYTEQKEAAKVCYFCKGNENLTPNSVYKDADDWNVRVFKNAFPIVDDHEVIVHSPHHDLDLPDLSDDQVIKYIRALMNRLNFYTSKEKEVLIINNRGGKAGASILHPHSQLVALAGFPGIIELEKNEALRYYNEKNSCFWCDLLISEVRESKRIVAETAHFLVVVPLASRWSYETMLIPKTHRPNMEYITEIEINDFAQVLKALLYAYDDMLAKPDRNYWVHTQRFDPYHWHMGFIPHTKVLGGLELGAGIWVSDRATPEGAANELGERFKKYTQKS